MRIIFTLIICSALFLGAAAFSKTYEITIDQFDFEPKVLEIHVGDSVRWVNESVHLHWVNQKKDSLNKADLFNSGPLSPGEEFTYEFSTAGDFFYFCQAHKLMKGEIKVVD